MGMTLFAIALLIGLAGVTYGLFLLILSKGRRIKGLKILVASPVLAVAALMLIASQYDLKTEGESAKSSQEERRLAAEREVEDAEEADGIREEQRRITEDEKRKAEERKLAEEHQKEQKCNAKLQCWGDKHSMEASFACDDSIPRLAKFTYEWTDGIVEPKFNRFRWNDAKKGTLTYIGDKIRFQNGFGAWQDMIYECDYDPSTKSIMDIRARPGRL